jgi:hypothetical protein
MGMDVDEMRSIGDGPTSPPASMDREGMAGQVQQVRDQ